MLTGNTDGLFNIRYFDTLARFDTPLHRLEPRAKLITTAVFIITVVSFPKYSLSALLPFSIFPMAILASSRIPVSFVLKKILLITPFALLIGIGNPWFDREIMIHLGPLNISGGWVSFSSIMLRFFLSVSTALLLLGCTGMNGICAGLAQLKVPVFFTTQLLLLYRYLFVLVAEAERMLQARALRAPLKKINLADTGVFLGQLLLRSIDRAERIYLAMRSRGFSGTIGQPKQSQLHWREWVFMLSWVTFFILFRLVNFSQLGGTYLWEWYS